MRGSFWYFALKFWTHVTPLPWSRSSVNGWLGSSGVWQLRHPALVNRAFPAWMSEIEASVLQRAYRHG
jgi:hypothetical protein